MSEDSVTPKNFEPVTPPLVDSKTESPVQEKAERKDKPLAALAAITVLSLAALALLFLPEKTTVNSVAEIESISVSTVETDTTDVSSEQAQTTTQSTNTAETPWADSQRQNARRQSQEVLSELIEIQQQLQQLRIEEWQPEALTSVQTEASQGDRAYQERRYEEAISLYESALSRAQGILTSAPEKAAELYALGSTSLENNQITSALRELELATLLDPKLQSASDMYERAKVREDVLALEANAERQSRDDSLELAQESYQQIRMLDPEYPSLEANLASVEAKILERDFRQAMSEGFTNLARSNLSAAQQAFEKAGSIKPNSLTVSEALQQVEAARINNQRQTTLDNAIAFEASERWSEALNLYQTLLAEDATLSSAQLGKIRSAARSELDTQIQTILDEPLRLQSEPAWQQANKVLADARNVIDRGPLLSAQITELDFAIKRARTKVTVALYSDSETNIEIYRMGELGQFKEHAVALYPGKYVILGKRSGYRDVREDLVLDGDLNRVELTIACTETI